MRGLPGRDRELGRGGPRGAVPGGDPALGTPSFYDSYLAGLGTNVFALVPQLKRAGIKQVTGRVYGDDTIFDRKRGVADSGYIVDVSVDPFQHRHYPCHAVAGTRELALREAHELVRWTKSTRQQKGQHFARKIRPQMLPTGFRKQPADVVFDDLAWSCRRSTAVPYCSGSQEN